MLVSHVLKRKQINQYGLLFGVGKKMQTNTNLVRVASYLLIRWKDGGRRCHVFDPLGAILPVINESLSPQNIRILGDDFILGWGVDATYLQPSFWKQVGNRFGRFSCQHRKKKAYRTGASSTWRMYPKKPRWNQKKKIIPFNWFGTGSSIINLFFLWVENGFVSPKNHPQNIEMLTHVEGNNGSLYYPNKSPLL